MASKGLNKPKGYEIEADGFSDLCITPQSQGLQVTCTCTHAHMRSLLRALSPAAKHLMSYTRTYAHMSRAHTLY